MAARRILVVDDEPSILGFLCHLLDAAGYETLYAQEPKKALEIISDPDPIDLVISDVVMPEMRGPELVAEISRRSPRTATMFMSGYADPAELSPAIPFLSKPFTRAALLAKVADVLGRAHESRAAESTPSSPEGRKLAQRERGRDAQERAG